ncbi:MAG: protein kinase [Chloroflexota bacterium]
MAQMSTRHMQTNQPPTQLPNAASSKAIVRPPVTQPPVTQPPVTQPPVTQSSTPTSSKPNNVEMPFETNGANHRNPYQLADTGMPNGNRHVMQQATPPQNQSANQNSTNGSEGDGLLSTMTGKVIGHYKVEGLMGGGTLSAVYRATDKILDRHVALKILMPGADRTARERFRREAKMATTLDHEHIVETLQVGQTSSDGVSYIAMELVEGLSLAELLEQHQTLELSDATNLLEPVARALAYAHRKNVVHRDVKPSNILLRKVAPNTPNSVQLSVLDYPVVPLLSDFGIALALDSPELTNVGRTIGTPAYMAPEQCSGSRDVDGRADIYALGTVLYRCIVGHPPFVGTTTQILYSHVYDPLTIPQEMMDKLPEEAINVLRYTLMKEAQHRYKDANLLANDLGTLAGRQLRSNLPSPNPKPINNNAETATMDELPITATNTATSILVPAKAPQTMSYSIPMMPPQNGPLGGHTISQASHILPEYSMTNVDAQKVQRRKNYLVGASVGAGLASILIAAAVVLYGTFIYGGSPAIPLQPSQAQLPEQLTNNGTVELDEGVTSPSTNVALGEPAPTNDVASIAQETSPLQGEPVIRSASIPNNSGGAGTPAIVPDNQLQTNIPSSLQNDNNAALTKPTISVEAAWASAEVFYTEENWASTVTWLNLLHSVDPVYKADQVQKMFFDAYFGLATQLTIEQNPDVAIQMLDEAIAIRPEGSYPTAETLADLRAATLAYIEAGNANKSEKWVALQREYRLYSDSLAAVQDYCAATKQIQLAMSMRDDPTLMGRLNDYQSRCLGEEPINPLVIDLTPAAGTLPQSTNADTGTLVQSEGQLSPDGNDVMAADMPATSVPQFDLSVIENKPFSTDEFGNALLDAQNALDIETLTGHIIYSTQADDTYQIYTYTPSKGSSVQVVNHGFMPSIAPNNQQMAFYSANDVFQGLGEIDLSTDLLNGESSNGGIDVMTDQTQISQLLQTTVNRYQSPVSWSPAGDRVVYSMRNGKDRLTYIYISAADESGQTRRVRLGSDPAWHPKQNWIVFNGTDEANTNAGLWLMQHDGRTPIELTDNANDSRPVWTPDNRHVVFMSNGRDGNWELYRVDIANQSILRLTQNSARDGLPAISPDGQKIAFLSDRGGAWQIWVMSIDGSIPQLLTDVEGDLSFWLEHSIQWVE